ncbi:hypothetical protein PFISCL1PPCAC_15629 [Pristionchus fissidentatus]|uniref:Rab-28 n=1 Tax=Pristionchus fissidentatus TaxID=1538716 RepID=A0AAV5W013_9BILA|nr:hypothetical protein PFISCL1PPCAC_15629 [Pristionchus fissidentatus]
MADDQHREQLLKIVVCGDGASGKTSLCLRFANETFDSDYHQTLGLDFFTRRIILPGEVGINLQVWDVGGQSIASSMIDKYVHGADGVIVVYDITNSASFDDVLEWVTTLKRLLKGEESIPVLALVGNKTDLDAKRQVKLEKHAAFAHEHELMSFYTSARTGDSVSSLFKQVAAQVMKIVMPKAELDKEIVPIMAEATMAQDVPRRGATRIAGQNNTTVCCIM